MLSFTKKKNSAVGPVQTSTKTNLKPSPSITQYLHKKITTVQAKKLWHQIIPNKVATITHSKTSSVLFDSNDHLSATSTPPTPPPKKSQTMPNLSIITDAELMCRALPSLPSAQDSISIGSSRNGITRAKTWVGKSIQKWLSTMEEQRKAVMMDLSELDEEEEERIMYSSSLLPNVLSEKMVLHCRILQVTNIGSAKNYQYTMNMRVTNNQTQVHTGVMKRVAKGISAAHPRAALSFDVQGRFQLECDLTIKQVSGNTIVNRLKSLRSRIDMSEDDDEEEEEIDAIKGQLVLDSGEDPLSSFANKGIDRYSIQTSTSATLELTIAFWLEESEQRQEFEDEESDEICTPIDQDVLRFCQAGDYLTFYVRSDTHPMWSRYWVTYQSNQLVLRSNERGAPVDKFGLKGLTMVDTNPSDDIKEEIYLGKKHGIVLTFNSSFMYLFCDNAKSVRYWKCLLEQHAVQTTENNNNSSAISRIQKKYLWVAQ